jgi:hypothetical protein
VFNLARWLLPNMFRVRRWLYPVTYSVKTPVGFSLTLLPPGVAQGAEASDQGIWNPLKSHYKRKHEQYRPATADESIPGRYGGREL